MVALVAATVSVEDPPALIDAALELIDTVGAAVDPLKFAPPPQAVSNAANNRLPEANTSN